MEGPSLSGGGASDLMRLRVEQSPRRLLLLGLDCDEVLAQTDKYFLGEVNRRLSANYHRKPVDPYYLESFLPSEVSPLVAELLASPEMYAGIAPDPDAVAVLESLSDCCRFVVITNISESFAAIRRSWLASAFSNINFHEVVCVTSGKEKARIACSMGVWGFVEDTTAIAIEMASAGIESFLLNRGWNTLEPTPETVHKVNSWREIEVAVRDKAFGRV